MLNDAEILAAIEKGSIVIKPFDRASLGTNSYDVHLGKTLARYKDDVLDAKRHNEIEYFEIPEEGYVLEPGKFYLGVTEEYTETHEHVPMLEGVSSLGRIGVFCHVTAGFGDCGFSNHWTLEIMCAQPVRIYPGMVFAQIYYHEFNYESCINKYDKKKNAKYNEVTGLPKESMMFKKFY